MLIIGGRLAAGLCIAATVAAPLYSREARAVPSMARQTSMPCATCHTVFPELTPFGRQFKLRGYTIGVPKAGGSILDKLPVAALLQVSRTETRYVSTQGAMPDSFPRDREVIVQGAGLYYGGKITEKSGALVQYFYDGIDRVWKTEMFDVRYAGTVDSGGIDLLYGITLSNSPGVTDIYNSAPMWSFPHNETAAVMPNAATQLDMTLASKVGGPGVYVMWSDLLYAEVAAYRTSRTGIFRPLGWGNERDPRVSGTAPYWRLALQRGWDSHSLSLGTYGLVVRTNEPGSGGRGQSDRPLPRHRARRPVPVHHRRTSDLRPGDVDPREAGVERELRAGGGVQSHEQPKDLPGGRALLLPAEIRRRYPVLPDERQCRRHALQHGRAGHGQRQRQSEQQRLDAGARLVAAAEREGRAALHELQAIQRRTCQLRRVRTQCRRQRQPLSAVLGSLLRLESPGSRRFEVLMQDGSTAFPVTRIPATRNAGRHIHFASVRSGPSCPRALEQSMESTTSGSGRFEG